MGDEFPLRLFDPLTMTAEELRHQLECGKLTSRSVVRVYWDQIQKHNKSGARLNALISFPPWEKLAERAEELDRERKAGRVRSPLHGIPVVVKDNIMTDWELGMPTTCGSPALLDAKAINAPVVETMIDAGMIIIGKGNLSELAGSKGYNITTGWSSVGGQTNTPYVAGGVVHPTKILGHSTPGGSSSGPAVAVAAGFAPLSLGTESDGSVVQPAGRASLYAMKVSVGALDTEGTSPLSPWTDSLGAMAKSPADLALFLQVLKVKSLARLPSTRDWKGQRIVSVEPLEHKIDPSICEYDENLHEKQVKDINTAIHIIERKGGFVASHVHLQHVDKVILDAKKNDLLEAVWNNDFKKSMDKFLELYIESKVRTVEELIQYNKENAHNISPRYFANQEILEDSLHKTLTKEKHHKAKTWMRDTVKQRLDRIFDKHTADLLIGPLDSRIATLAALAGYPCGTVPLGYAWAIETGGSGRAYGLVLVARKGREARILEAMASWEATMPSRKAPPLLVNWDRNHGESPRLGNLWV